MGWRCFSGVRTPVPSELFSKWLEPGSSSGTAINYFVEKEGNEQVGPSKKISTGLVPRSSPARSSARPLRLNGDGETHAANAPQILAANLHIHYENDHRGYFICEVDRKQMRIELRVAPIVSKASATLETAATS